MTDNEIIKALECCVNGEDCPNCPLQEQFADCKPMTGALDLINRQKAEIERLERHTEMYHEVRAEAVKEFAERFEAILATYECTFIETQNWSARNTILQVIQELRNLVKETEAKT